MKKMIQVLPLLILLFAGNALHSNAAVASTNAAKANFDIELKAYQFDIYGCSNASHAIPVRVINRSASTIKSVPVMSIDVKDTAWERISVWIDPGDSAVIYLSDSILKPNVGTYLVRVLLDTLDDNQSNNTANILYHFDRTPKPAFTVSEECYLDTTVFTNQTNTSGFTGVSYKWLFGTGDTSNKTHARYLYHISDTFTTESYFVTLISIVNGCNDSAVKTATVRNLPDASFTAETIGHELVISNQPTTITGYTYYWDFGDGTTSSEHNPTHYYDKPGMYEVCLTVITEYGCESTTCGQVTYSASIGRKNGAQPEIQLIPNPAAEVVNVSGLEGYANQSDFHIALYSFEGKQLNVFSEQWTFDVSDLESGLYFVHISGNSIEKSLPLVVQ